MQGGKKASAARVVTRFLRENKRIAVDSHAVRELELFIPNDYQIYSRSFQPVEKNQLKHLARGNWTLEGSIKGFMYVVDAAAKKYVQDFSSGERWHEMFPKDVRLAVAKGLAEDFQDEYVNV